MNRYQEPRIQLRFDAEDAGALEWSKRVVRLSRVPAVGEAVRLPISGVDVLLRVTHVERVANRSGGSVDAIVVLKRAGNPDEA